MWYFPVLRDLCLWYFGTFTTGLRHMQDVWSFTTEPVVQCCGRCPKFHTSLRVPQKYQRKMSQQHKEYKRKLPQNTLGTRNMLFGITGSSWEKYQALLNAWFLTLFVCDPAPCSGFDEACWQWEIFLPLDILIYCSLELKLLSFEKVSDLHLQSNKDSDLLSDGLS